MSMALPAGSNKEGQTNKQTVKQVQVDIGDRKHFSPLGSGRDKQKPSCIASSLAHNSFTHFVI